MSTADTTIPITEDSDHETGLLIRLKSLGADVEALRSTDAWRAWLKVSSRFWKYSFGNQILIAVQNPAATQVAGYRKWLELKRQVRKGEKGIRICAPIVRKQDDGTNRIAAFKVVSVFDVSQTDGEPLPEHPPWPMAGGSAHATFDNLMSCATAEGLRVYTPDPMDTPRSARGWYDANDKSIAIRDCYYETDGLVEAIIPVPNMEQATVLLHELGHHFDPLRSTRTEGEIVAESVAYIVGQNLGLDVEEGATAYLASWNGTAAEILAAGRRITAAVKDIERILTEGAQIREDVA